MGEQASVCLSVCVCRVPCNLFWGKMRRVVDAMCFWGADFPFTPATMTYFGLWHCPVFIPFFIELSLCLRCLFAYHTDKKASMQVPSVVAEQIILRTCSLG